MLRANISRMVEQFVRSGTGPEPLDQEIMAEKASALGRSGRKVEDCLERLAGHEGGDNSRAVLLKETADAVYAYFIQRELCGMRRHDDVIRMLSIPREVLAKLGAR